MEKSLSQTNGALTLPDVCVRYIRLCKMERVRFSASYLGFEPPCQQKLRNSLEIIKSFYKKRITKYDPVTKRSSQFSPAAISVVDEYQVPKKSERALHFCKDFRQIFFDQREYACASKDLFGDGKVIIICELTSDTVIQGFKKRLAELNTFKWISRNIPANSLSPQFAPNYHVPDDNIIFCICKMKTTNGSCGCLENKNCKCWSASALKYRAHGLSAENLDYFKTFIVMCGPKCSCKGKCKNSLPESSNYKLALYYRLETMGLELVAQELIPPGQIICTFVGEVFSKDLADRLDEEESKNFAEFAFELYEPGDENFSMKSKKLIPPAGQQHLYVCPATKGNLGRFVTHSCYPNIAIMRFLVNSRRIQDAALAFVSLEPILPRTLLGFHYGDKYASENLVTGCLCSSATCTASMTKEIAVNMTRDEIYSYTKVRLHDLISRSLALANVSANEIGLQPFMTDEEYEETVKNFEIEKAAEAYFAVM